MSCAPCSPSATSALSGKGALSGAASCWMQPSIGAEVGVHEQKRHPDSVSGGLQELRNANAVLADELMKARSGSDQVRDQLREKELSVEALQATIERLEKARKLVDKKHLLQLKELNRRYKEEQAQRLTLEAECAQLRASKSVVHHQVESLQEERAQLMDLLNSQRSNSSRLEATVAADAGTIAELRSRLQTAESRLSDEVAARQDLFGRQKALEADLKLATERHSTLVASSSEAEARVRAVTAKMQLLEDELEAAKKALQAEKAAFAAERQRTASLQSDLTQLQTSAQLAAAAATAEQAEVERLRVQAEQLMVANEALRTDVAKLREEVLHLSSQQAAAQANAQTLQQQRDQLQQQRDDLQLQLVEAHESKDRLERSLREEIAGRARSAQEDAAVRQLAYGEELAAKQRQWEGQLRTRENAWEDERNAMRCAHREELKRKDLELLEVRERMREAQSSLGELAAEVSTFKYQSEHYAEVHKKNEELSQRLAKAEETVKARDASLAEAAGSHAAQLELWKAEANEVAQAAAKWKQRCTTLQAQLEVKESELEAVEQEVRSLTAKLGASETERVRLQEALASTESKLALATQDSSSYRSQLADVLVSNETAARQVEAVQQDMQLRDMQELEGKRRALDELTVQLREAERGRVLAQAETERLRDRVVQLTREVDRARMVADVVTARSGGGGTNVAAALRRSADAAADAWGGSGGAGYGQQFGGRGGGSAATAAPRLACEPSDLDEGSAALDRRAYSQRGGTRGGASTAPATARQPCSAMDLDDELTLGRQGYSRRAGTTRGGGESLGAARSIPVPFDVEDMEEDEEELDRRAHRGRSTAGGRREYHDVSAMEEEAESWFKSLDEEKRSRRQPTSKEIGRPAGRGAGTSPRGANVRQPDFQRGPEASPQHRHPQPQAQQPQRQHHDQHPHVHPHAGIAHPQETAQADAAEAGCVRTYDVTISHQPGTGVSEGGGRAAQPQAPPPAAAHWPAPQAASYPVLPMPSTSSAGFSTGGAAAVAAAAYTAYVTPVEQGASGYTAHASATPQPATGAPPPHRTVSLTTSPSPASSAARYAPIAQQRQPHRTYGISALQQQPSYPYTRSDGVRLYAAMTPVSPVFSESASNASSNLQERLQRLLGTGKLS
ncbi:hypothetical protein VOLCADRAFT_86779 [Volvox carteri f. nagariensis]|uniref:Uncharacterized protein n=1 Tax=Volvox carteri f. nagariensis TaxID=3068 RepID=D8TJK6_VOLCA|nr:uncharacterized protein VOLCADRAFT_86779 [Volvox carteri f. nagariensis]EFJ52559.1 hypothetical protein VOLCADRAFT_86779 [Volvox carteri f. nagariensis]|eukprot:XP_002946632.1 hypothetical protein VOLCADRAFT_86779 [Volvox carteri f. nagariensis]